MKDLHRLAPWSGLLLVWLCATPALAWTPSPDVGLLLGSGVFEKADVVADGGAPSAAVDLGPLPAGADVVAFTLNDHGDVFFVLGHTMELPGGVIANPQTVIAYDDSTGLYAEELDLGDFGLPRNVAIDAIGIRFATASIGVSFDTTVEFLGIVVDDADILDIFLGTKIFDAAAAGIAPGLDLDAFSEGTSGDFMVSFDSGGSVGGITFSDEDLLRVGGPGYVWSLEVDASTLDLAWGRADVDAVHTVPEPGRLCQLAAGSFALVAMARRRSPRGAALPLASPTAGEAR